MGVSFEDVCGSARPQRNVVAYAIVCYSAGVGRTGTYMALDYLLQQAKTEGVVDVCGCVSLLREKRMDMVQMLVSIILVTFQRFKPSAR